MALRLEEQEGKRSNPNTRWMQREEDENKNRATERILPGKMMR